MALGLGSRITKGGLTTPGIVTDNLVMKHNYSANGNIPVSDGAAYFAGAGTDDHIDIVNSDDFDTGTGDFSVSFWIRCGTAAQSDKIINRWHGDIAGWFVLVSSDGKIRPRIDDNTNFAVDSSATTITDNIWHHVAVVWDFGANHYVYIDGVLDDTVDISSVTGAPDNNDRVTIGANNQDLHSGSLSEDFTGYLCNMGFWKRALSQTEVKSIMWKNYAGLTDTEKTNLVSWWNLDEAASNDKGHDGVTAGVSAGDLKNMALDNHGTFGSEIIDNNGFEDASISLSNYNSASTFERVTSESYSGNGSLHIVTSGSGWSGANSAGFTSSSGDVYKITGYIKRASGSGDIKLFAREGDGGAWNLNGTVISPSSNNQWEYFSTYYYEYAGGGAAYIQFAANNTVEDFYLDDISVKKAGGNPGVLI